MYRYRLNLWVSVGLKVQDTSQTNLNTDTWMGIGKRSMESKRFFFFLISLMRDIGHCVWSKSQSLPLYFSYMWWMSAGCDWLTYNQISNLSFLITGLCFSPKEVLLIKDFPNTKNWMYIVKEKNTESKPSWVSEKEPEPFKELKYFPRQCVGKQ